MQVVVGANGLGGCMKVVVIDPDFAGTIAVWLRKDFPELDVRTAPDSGAAKDIVGDCNVIMALAMHADNDLFEHADALEWIQAFSAGVEKFTNLPTLKDLRHLTNAAGIHGPQIAELSFLFMISLLRGFPNLVRQQDAKVWNRKPGRKLDGRKILIWGLGTIGTNIARLAKAFGMEVAAVTRTPRAGVFVDTFYAPSDLIDAARDVDFLIAVAPATPQNIGALNADVFRAMPRDSALINVGRGSLVNEPDLIAALQTGEIAGAALDVVSQEPLPPENPLWSMENVILTPHIAGMIEEYADQVYPIVKTNMAHFLAGQPERMMNRIA